MFKPIGNFVFAVDEKSKESIIERPDGAKPVGSVFRVLDIGKGYYDNGILIKPEVKVGDVICVVGEMKRIPIEEMVIWCIPASQIIAYERPESKDSNCDKDVASIISRCTREVHGRSVDGHKQQEAPKCDAGLDEIAKY